MKWAPPLALAAIAVLAVFVLSVAEDPDDSGACDAAARRGLEFIHRTAMVPANFEEYGHDYLWCFCAVAATSADPELRVMARRFGRERALRWRAAHQDVPPDAGANEVHQLISGSQAADCLGVRGGPPKEAIRQAAARLSPERLYGFDPAAEPPPEDVPKRCRLCGTLSPRGNRACPRCGTKLELWDRYELWCDAIIGSFMGDSYGMRLGSSFADVARWSSWMIPYPDPRDAGEAFYRHAAYSVTHLVYAFNGYGRFRLRPESFPREFGFLSSNLMHTVEKGDLELVGEHLDTLRSFGLTASDPRIAAGIRFLLERQNPDGSWGDPAAQDVYNRYHTTWTAMDGLRAYAWQDGSVTFPEALRRVQPTPVAAR